MKGRIRLHLDLQYVRECEEGEFIYVPTGYIIEYKALENCSLIFLCLSKPLSISLASEVDRLYRIEAEKENDTDIRGVDKLLLKANTRIMYYLEGLANCISDGLNGGDFIEVKTEEFFYLLRTYYTKEQIRNFCYLVLNLDVSFSEYIKRNYTRYKSAKEIAKAMNMPSKKFSEQFREVFGTTAYQWIKEQKVSKIQREILENRKSNKEIAYGNGFMSTQQFYDFCREQIGSSPAQLRVRNGSTSCSE